MENKSKGILNKIIEKFYEEFIDDQELSDDMKKRLSDIYNKFVPPSNHQPSHAMTKNIMFQLNQFLHPIPIGLLVPHNNQFKLMTKVT